MRISERALENIRAVIEQQETEWLKDNGFDPVPHRPEPRILRRKTKEGNFSADRFLGNASPAEEPKQEFSPAPAPQEHDNSPEAVEIIPQKDGRHSWLYNEVMKAIRDAAGDGTNTKVIAVFVPVVQNGREFEDLPVSAKVELSPVNEENVRIDVVEIPAVESEPEPVEEPEPEEPVHVEPEPEPVEEPAHVEPEPEPEAASEPVDHVGDLLPTEHIEHDQELVEAFTTMEEKLDEHIAESQEVHEDEEETSEPEIMNFTEELDSSEEGEPAGLLPLPDPAEIEGFDEQVSGQEEEFTDDEIIDEPEENSAGEKMAFTEITLPPALEDDEVLDDGIEIQDDHEDNIKL